MSTQNYTALTKKKKKKIAKLLSTQVFRVSCKSPPRVYRCDNFFTLKIQQKNKAPIRQTQKTSGDLGAFFPFRNGRSRWCARGTDHYVKMRDFFLSRVGNYF